MPFYIKDGQFLITPNNAFAQSCPDTVPQPPCCNFFAATPQYSRVISVPFRNQNIGASNAIADATWTGFLTLRRQAQRLDGNISFQTFNIPDMSVFDGSINSASIAFGVTPPFPDAPTIPGTCAYSLRFETFPVTVNGQSKPYEGQQFNTTYQVRLTVDIRSLYRETLIQFTVSPEGPLQFDGVNLQSMVFRSRRNFSVDGNGTLVPNCTPSFNAFYNTAFYNEFPDSAGNNFWSSPRSWTTAGGGTFPTSGVSDSWSMNLGYTLLDAQGFQYPLEFCPAVRDQVVAVFCPPASPASATGSQPSGDCGCGCGDCG